MSKFLGLAGSAPLAWASQEWNKQTKHKIGCLRMYSLRGMFGIV
jgi:hypothetical protein